MRLSLKPTSVSGWHDRSDIICRIGLVLCIAVILQSLKYSLMPHYQNFLAHLLNATVHLCLFSSSIYFAYKALFKLARALLIVSFISYVSIACVLWQVNLNIQYFFLLGLFVSTYLFDKHEHSKLIITASVFCVSFVWFQTSLLYPVVVQPWHEGLLASNAVVMMFASLLCANAIRITAAANWRKLTTQHYANQSVLYKIIPKALCPYLLARDDSSINTITTSHPYCSVIFIDFTHFTEFSKCHNEHDIVQTLHNIFCQFDALARQHQLEKIKTNGDQYMIASGISGTSTCADNLRSERIRQARITLSACEFALDVKRWFLLQRFTPQMSIRIGIASGPAVAGIIGQDKPAYDLWGNTVNTASRLEANAVRATVSVCNKTYINSRQHLLFAAKQSTHLKGLGIVSHYRLLGKK